MTPSDTEAAKRFQLAREAGWRAARSTLEHFQTADLIVERKGDRSPVTAADRGAERLLREEIERAFPEDGILGEEYDERSGSSGYRWILDPIDGTKSFITGVPLFGTMVGVEYERRCVIGVVVIPALNECVFAAVGQGAWHERPGLSQPVRAQVSDRSLSDGAFLTSQIDGFAARNAGRVFSRLEKASAVTRTWGDCYGYLLVATGRAELMVDAEMSIWDAAALQPIIEEAGGSFTDWSGQPTIHSGEAVGCNQRVRDEVLAIIAEHQS